MPSPATLRHPPPTPTIYRILYNCADNSPTAQSNNKKISIKFRKLEAEIKNAFECFSTNRFFCSAVQVLLSQKFDFIFYVVCCACVCVCVLEAKLIRKSEFLITHTSARLFCVWKCFCYFIGIKLRNIDVILKE